VGILSAGTVCATLIGEFVLDHEWVHMIDFASLMAIADVMRARQFKRRVIK